MTERMTIAGLHAFVERLIGEDDAAEARLADNAWQFELEGHLVTLVCDASADRMRIMAPIIGLDELEAGMEHRMLQANFDAVLDARYAIAQGLVWSAFLRPMSTVTDDALASGLAQVVIAAETFGTTYTSGAMVFGGGDSQNAHNELYVRLLQRSRENPSG